MSKTEPRLDRSQSMGAIPVPNRGVESYPSDDGGALMLVVQREPFRNRLLQAVAPVVRERRIELDEVGTAVWRMLDGQRSVREVIGRFSEEFGVNRREAEVSVLDFLKSLMGRGLLSMQVPRQAEQ